MSDELDEIENEETPGSDLEKRRKLLKASIAAPLIATLPSGLAQAATSAFQCAGGEYSNIHECPDVPFKEGDITAPYDGSVSFVEDNPTWGNGNSCASDNAKRIMVQVYYLPDGNSCIVNNNINTQDLLYYVPSSYVDGNPPTLGLMKLYNHQGVEYIGSSLLPDQYYDDLSGFDLCYAGLSEVLVMYKFDEVGISIEDVGVWPQVNEDGGFSAVTQSCLTSIVDNISSVSAQG